MEQETKLEPIKATFLHKEVVNAVMILCPLSINKDYIGSLSEKEVRELAFNFIKEVATGIIHHLMCDESDVTITRLIKKSNLKYLESKTNH